MVPDSLQIPKSADVQLPCMAPRFYVTHQNLCAHKHGHKHGSVCQGGMSPGCKATSLCILWLPSSCTGWRSWNLRSVSSKHSSKTMASSEGETQPLGQRKNAEVDAMYLRCSGVGLGCLPRGLLLLSFVHMYIRIFSIYQFGIKQKFLVINKKIPRGKFKKKKN